MDVHVFRSSFVSYESTASGICPVIASHLAGRLCYGARYSFPTHSIRTDSSSRGRRAEIGALRGNSTKSRRRYSAYARLLLASTSSLFGGRAALYHNWLLHLGPAIGFKIEATQHIAMTYVSKPLFFIHPPKCGGSTVISFFDLNLDRDKFINFVWGGVSQEKTRERFLASGIGGGHDPIGIHRDLKMPLEYCSILREPLRRQISHYWFARNGKNGGVARGVSVSEAEALAQGGELSLDDWVGESCSGKNLFVQMLSGHGRVNRESLELAIENVRQHIPTVGVCEDMSDFLLRLCGRTGMRLPFFIRTNVTEGVPKECSPLSERAREKFVEDNHLDYELYRYVCDEIARERESYGAIYTRAIEAVRQIQRRIDALDNPYIYTGKSNMFGFDENHLRMVREVATSADLSPIDAYIELAQSRRRECGDLFDGFVDAVNDDMVHGWAVNLSVPDKCVPIEIWVREKLVATTLTGNPRPDVAAAGYASERCGFAVRLPEEAQEGFRVKIAGSAQTIRSAGTWQRGWHMA
ncbi:chondroitin 4-O-sulfotransferase [Paraburkholderia youngii]|uniref:chondroitin 4-O-sulfotransferase n=1 Tax=Paraburkholderia youngii TaxID=2782701 RepID=UPI00359F202C